MRVNFACVWVGDKYGPEYVEKLRDSVLRHSTEMDHECAFWAVTDRPDDLPLGVHAIAADPTLPGWWSKLSLFDPKMPWEVGDRVVYFDLDVAITGRLEDLVERPGIIKDFLWPGYNSSVMVWTHGERSEVYTAFRRHQIDGPGHLIPRDLLAAGKPNGGDQEWIYVCADALHDPWPIFPAGWFRSYRASRDWPPEGCKAVIFHGDPKPADITDGWVPNVWKVGGMTALPEFTGVNTSEDQRLANVRSAVKRDLPWFTGFGDEGGVAVIVCGAPSMKDSLPQIKAQKRRGARIISVNNAWRFLAENGITPDVNVMVDARPQNVEFVKGAPKSMRFLLAGQVHSDVFDALAEHEVVLWHNGYGDNTPLREILDPWWDGPDARPCILVPGGSTVGLRCLWLATFSGFRTIHMYGIDGSYADDGAHHAYPQALNDHEAIIDVEMGDKTYRCAPWMCRQAAEFRQTWHDLQVFEDPATGKPSPVTIHVHGVGLIPDIARRLRAERRAA